MELKNQNNNSNFNSSYNNKDEIINRIQNSLNKLQLAINNKQILTNARDKANIASNNINISKHPLDNENNLRKENSTLTEGNNSNQLHGNYTKINPNNSAINKGKRINPRLINKNMPLFDVNSENIINRTTQNIPRSTQERNTFFNKINYNSNRNRNNNNNITRKKCYRCGNINPSRSKFCLMCGNSFNNNNIFLKNYSAFEENINMNNRFLTDYNINDIREGPSTQAKTQIKDINNIKNSKKDLKQPQNNKIFNNIFKDLNNIQNEESINYKKLNDLYLYGDYLESELKASNDENVRLLEKYKQIKIQVHSLNQKNKTLLQNISSLIKKDKELEKLNLELKKGFNFVQEKFENELNFNQEDIEEKKNILNQLELNNKKYVETENNYEKEIEELKKKISALVDEDDENDENENLIKIMENDIEKGKKELEEKNLEYILLTKKNDLLSKEIKLLAQELELENEENYEGEEIEEEEKNNEEIKENNINQKKILNKQNPENEKEIINSNINANNMNYAESKNKQIECSKDNDDINYSKEDIHSDENMKNDENEEKDDNKIDINRDNKEENEKKQKEMNEINNENIENNG